MVEYVYDAWGNHTVSGSNIELGNKNPFRYRSYFYDTETGLYFLKARYYDPAIGRFLSKDSFKYVDPQKINGLNLYAYCCNNPVIYVDPNGCSPEWWQWLLFGIGAALVVASAVILTVASGGAAAGLFGAIAVGAAKGATTSFVRQASSGEMNLGSFFIDTAIGALSGAFSYGVSVIFSSVGASIGSALSEVTIKGLKVGKVFASGILAGIGSIVGYVVGGFSSGVFFDKFVNNMFGREDDLQERLKNNFDGSFISLLLDLLGYLW